MKKTILAASAALALLSCGVTTNYIGRRYPATEAPEIYAAWEDVPCAYETMGRIEAEPRMFKTLEDAQTAIERRARETGADAIVFTGIRRLVQEPTRTSTEETVRDTKGNETRTRTESVESRTTERLEATFIKYRK